MQILFLCRFAALFYCCFWLLACTAAHSQAPVQHHNQVNDHTSGYLNRLAQSKNMKIFAITGGPASGKSTLLRKLKASGQIVVEESAREVIQQAYAQGDNTPWLRADFQDRVSKLYFDKLQEVLSRVPARSHPIPVFIDRGPLDTLAYFKLQSRPVSDYVRELLRFHSLSCEAVFLLGLIPDNEVMTFDKNFHASPIPNLRPDGVRRENTYKARYDNVQAIHAVYQEHGIELIPISAIDLLQREHDVLQQAYKRLGTACPAACIASGSAD